jgi:hypothetical protein
MDPDDLLPAYASKPDEELRSVIVAHSGLAQAIVAAHPEMAQDAGFELFDAAWARRYWRSVVAEVAGIDALNRVASWVVGASIGQLASLIAARFALPPPARPAAVALAVVLLRAARSMTGGRVAS